MWDRILEVLVGGGVSTPLFVVASVFILTVAINRFIEWLQILSALARIRWRNPSSGLAGSLNRCIQDARVTKGDEGTFVDIELLRREIRLRLPRLAARWCDGDDRPLHWIPVISPLIGMSASIFGSVVRTDVGITSPDLLMPTGIGVATAAAAFVVSSLIAAFNLPVRLARSPRALKKNPKSVVLHAHAAPAMAMVFFVAFGDLFFALYMRAQVALQGPVRQGEMTHDAGGSSGSEAPFLELFAHADGHIVLGDAALPLAPAERSAAIAGVLQNQLASRKVPALIRISTWCDPEVSQGVLLPLKQEIQAEIHRILNGSQHTVLQFEDRLVVP